MSTKKSCEILIALARSEKQLEILRQTLCELPNFEPYAAFRHLDIQHKNFLQTPDFQEFFSKNQANFDDNSIEEILIKHYDYDHDGKLCYAEFLKVILPNDEPGLRTLVTQRPTYVGELPEEIEENLLKLIQTEISTMLDLEPMKKELGGSGVINELFREIDKESTGFINFANLFEFFKKNGIYPYEEEIIAIIRKLDKDDDGRLVLEELEEGLGSITANRPINGYNSKYEDGNNNGRVRVIKELTKNAYKNDTFNPGNYGQNQNTSLKKSNKYEGKYIPKFQYDEQLTEKGPSKYDRGNDGSNKSQEKLSRSYNYKETTTSYQPKDYQQKDYQPKDSQQKDYQPKDYQPKDYQPKDYQQKEQKELLYSFKDPNNNNNLNNNNNNNNNYSQKETTNYQKSTITTSYVKRNINNPNENPKEPEETKDYLNKYLQKDYKNTSKPSSNLKSSADYPNNNQTKSPPRTFYYPYEPLRKAFSPMKDKILKSSRFDAQEDPYERKTKSQLYQSNSNNRTRTPNQPRAEPWKIEDKLKKIDDTYAKNSRYHGMKGDADKRGPDDLIRSAPKQVLYRDYTPDPATKRNLYKTEILTPDKMFETNYLQSSQYRQDRDIVDKILGSSEKPTSYKPGSSSKQDYNNNKLKTPVKSTQQANNNNNSSNEFRDLAVFLGSLMNFEAELERMKQDLALRPDFNLVDLFVFFDKDQKGYCTLEDFQETLRNLDLFVQEKEAILFIKRFDRGGSGMMKFADFTQGFTPILSDYVELLNQRKPINTDLQFGYKELFSQETLRLISNIFRAHFTNEIAIEGLRKALARKEELDLRKIFECLDLDQDGFLVESEIEEFVGSMGIGMNWNKNDVKLLLDRMDNDRDGKVCYEEFCFELNSKLEELE